MLIAGSIGLLGIAPEIGRLPHDEIRRIYREQALRRSKSAASIFFILETFSNIELLLAAVDAIRSFSALPIVAQMTFSEEGTLRWRHTPAEAATRLVPKNVQAIGATARWARSRCCRFSKDWRGGAAALRHAQRRFSQRVGDRIVYPRSSPEYFRCFRARRSALGARIVGGCCGTRPSTFGRWRSR